LLGSILGGILAVLGTAYCTLVLLVLRVVSPFGASLQKIDQGGFKIFLGNVLLFEPFSPSLCVSNGAGKKFSLFLKKIFL
jgi:uncharacterized membrane protein YccF (DUF307 family)